ncbi:hypothetical protein B0J15DRAFT_243766 [Fusarium solani]|uniref:Uncharacterized protein n=1 Tax=Fusarium solani TaxID=169388 RepID=A0A9P9HZC8_FUSSL|nr:uncharacterized protein B0J15DRAFT_243766 [Fusarium solani]KAH7266300.1 hypothetical protein B0J15DRAFT_243766 [Fusarium solani]
MARERLGAASVAVAYDQLLPPKSMAIYTVNDSSATNSKKQPLCITKGSLFPPWSSMASASCSSSEPLAHILVYRTEDKPTQPRHSLITPPASCHVLVPIHIHVHIHLHSAHARPPPILPHSPIPTLSRLASPWSTQSFPATSIAGPVDFPSHSSRGHVLYLLYRRYSTYLPTSPLRGEARTGTGTGTGTERYVPGLPLLLLLLLSPPRPPAPPPPKRKPSPEEGALLRPLSFRLHDSTDLLIFFSFLAFHLFSF